MILTLETVKAYLQISHSVEDELLAILVESAQEFVSGYTGIHFHAGDDTVTERLDGGGENLWLRYLPLKELVSVVDLEADGAVVEERLRFTQTRIMRETEGQTWGRGTGRYEASYRAGYSEDDCPAGLKHLLLDLVYRHYRLRGDKAADGDRVAWRSLAASGGLLRRLNDYCLRVRSVG